MVRSQPSKGDLKRRDATDGLSLSETYALKYW